MTNAAEPYDAHTNATQMRLASGLQIIAGLYMLISVWIGATGTGHAWNGIIFGIVIAVLATSRFVGSTGPWASWVNALIGVWLIVSPFIVGYAGSGWEWNSIILGIIIALLGVWSAVAGSSSRRLAA
jgi:hypothetical protein